MLKELRLELSVTSPSNTSGAQRQWPGLFGKQSILSFQDLIGFAVALGGVVGSFVDVLDDQAIGPVGQRGGRF